VSLAVPVFPYIRIAGLPRTGVEVALFISASISACRPKEEEPDEEEKEDTLTAMTYSKSKNLSAFLSKVSATAESVTGTPIDQLEKRLALLKY